MTWSKVLRAEKTWLLLWFVICLILGGLTAHQYGMSIDEPNNYRYAADTLDAYPSLFGILYTPKYSPTYDGHGPAFVAIVSLLIRIIQRVFPNVFEPDLWHFSYYITFLLTALCLYWLSRRWFSRWTAWTILFLFSTQPLLLGHAFINPKDIPFMFFFTSSIVMGFRLVDGMEGQEPFSSLQGTVGSLSYKFQQADQGRKRRFLIFLVLALSTVLVLALFSQQINLLIEQTVTYFYTASPDTLAGRIFSAAASQASTSTARAYAAKSIKLLHRAELGLLVLGLLFFLAYFGLLIGNTSFSTSLRKGWKQAHQLCKSASENARRIAGHINWSSIKTWLIGFFQSFRSSRLILAGVVLGLATAIRAIAPLAGLIVFIYLFSKTRSRSWTRGMAYFLVAGMTTYLAYPYLWAAPIQRYWQEVFGASNFQNFSGQVLFDGQFYGIRDLPRLYLPILLNLQFTEPLLLCVYMGLYVLFWRLLRNRIRTDLLIYLGMGSAVPLLMLILLNSPLYHNFRHVLFLTPALFILAGFTLDLVYSRMVHAWARLFLIVLLILPGAYAAVKLYPYEYVYYNSLIGGTAGASNRYELDYWRTSLREAAIQLNDIAPSGAKIVIAGSSGLFRRYSKADLVVDTLTQNTYDLNGGYDFAVQLSRWQKWEVYPDAKIEILIERDGAVLATVKAVKNVSLR